MSSKGMPTGMYQKNILGSVLYRNGYDRPSKGVSDILSIRIEPARQKINKGRFSYRDMVLLAKRLDMTPREFIETFFHGLFIEE